MLHGDGLRRRRGGACGGYALHHQRPPLYWLYRQALFRRMPCSVSVQQSSAAANGEATSFREGGAATTAACRT